MIVALMLPECSGSQKDFIALSRSMTFERLKDFKQLQFISEREYHVNMIWHDGVSVATDTPSHRDNAMLLSLYPQFLVPQATAGHDRH